MVYMSAWETLTEALGRVMATTGVSQVKARADLCHAVADRVVRVQAKLGKNVARGTVVSNKTVEGDDMLVPTSLAAEDFDWEASRPLKPWVVENAGRGHPGHWYLDWIKVSSADVTNAFRGIAPDNTAVAYQAARKAAKARKARPSFDRARRAVLAIYPLGVPSQADQPNKILFRKVSDWLKNNRLEGVSTPTILRAAGRRK